MNDVLGALASQGARPGQARPVCASLPIGPARRFSGGEAKLFS